MDMLVSGLRARIARFAVPVCAVCVAAFAFFRVSSGLAWSSGFHPDEQKISMWIRQSSENGYVTDRAYPGGWFVLADLAAAARKAHSDLSRRWNAWRTQDGAVVTTDTGSFGRIPVREPFRPGDVQAGRDLNAMLFVAAVLFLFFAALETGCGVPAALFAALLFSFQPSALEHAHYCETDMALVASFCLSAWWAVRALRRGSLRWACASCAAAGFAIAGKFTLTPFLVCLPAIAWALPGRPGEKRAHAVPKRAGLCALATAAGFLAGTPALLFEPSFFLADLVRIGGLTYAENDRALGAGHSYWTACLWRAGSCAVELAKLGPATLVLFAVSELVWFASRFRRLAPVFALFPVAFAVHAVFCMPWIRSQELLPVLPVLCLGTAPVLSLAAAAFRKNASAAKKAAAAAVLAAAAVAFCTTFRTGERILSCFRRRDTRAECQNWLAAAARPGLGFATEKYVAQTVRGVDCTVVPHERSAKTWPALLGNPAAAEAGVRYLIRNASYAGRATVGDRDRENEARFRRECIRLAAWTIAPGGVRTTTFAQPDVELWALPAPEDAPAPADVPICLDRPVFFAPGLRPLYAPEEPSPGVGPVRATATVGMRHAVHPAADGPGWAVSRVLAGPKAGSVVWEGLFEPARADLSAAGTAVFRLDGRAMRRAAACDVRPVTRVRLRGADDQATVCTTQPSSDPAEIARILRRAGDPAAALAFLRERDAPDAAARVEAFLAARDAGVAPEPEWTAAAREALAAFDAACAAGEPLPGTRVRGVPLRVLRDFATVRLGDWDGLPGPGYLPVFLPAGRYRVSAVPHAPKPAARKAVWFKGQEGPLSAREDEDGTVRSETTVRTARDGLLRATLDPETDKVDGRFFRALSVEWDPFEQLVRAAGELRAALSSGTP